MINTLVNISGWLILLLPASIIFFMMNDINFYLEYMVYACISFYTIAALFSLSYFLMSIKCVPDVAWGIIYEQKLDASFLSKIPYYILIICSGLLSITLGEYLLASIIMISVVINTISYTLLSYKASKASYEKNTSSQHNNS